MQQFYNELIETLLKKKLSKESFHKLKVKLCKKYKIKKIPTDIQVLLHATPSQIPKLNLVTKPTRTISGVAVVAVMSYPFSCPHGKCTICPGGPASFFGDVPQSYTGKEPATMRAIRNQYDAYLQVFNRLEHYIVMGHVPDKVELIIMGGTFPSFEMSNLFGISPFILAVTIIAIGTQVPSCKFKSNYEGTSRCCICRYLRKYINKIIIILWIICNNKTYDSKSSFINSCYGIYGI